MDFDDISVPPAAIADATSFEHESKIEERTTGVDLPGGTFPDTVTRSPSHSDCVTICSSHRNHTVEVMSGSGHATGFSRSVRETSIVEATLGQTDASSRGGDNQ
ncbi:hypothetical protein GN958_ATG22695 [Phytophthora infestans]|uniref:Uncharacterized protein n=1 Tax=Phytophthora infestans TaxID=4787 RepID=A0A8S9TN79_PHYIN|nr:hypothetical protein GN958_ATG22695 [Phytophthora infestans]